MRHQGGPFLIYLSGQNKEKDNEGEKKKKQTHSNKNLKVRLGKMKIMDRNSFYSLPTSAKEGGSMVSGAVEIQNRRLSFTLWYLCVFSKSDDQKSMHSSVGWYFA